MRDLALAPLLGCLHADVCSVSVRAELSCVWLSGARWTWTCASACPTDTPLVGSTYLPLTRVCSSAAAFSSDNSSWDVRVESPPGSPAAPRGVSKHGQDRGVIPGPFGGLRVNSPDWVRHIRRCVQGEWEPGFPPSGPVSRWSEIQWVLNQCCVFHFLSPRWNSFWEADHPFLCCMWEVSEPSYTFMTHLHVKRKRMKST